MLCICFDRGKVLHFVHNFIIIAVFNLEVGLLDYSQSGILYSGEFFGGKIFRVAPVCKFYE